ncbi:MAG: DegV family protein [Clostridia bacterium]|nr:DegV family protein [Clostridia bacterium]
MRPVAILTDSSSDLSPELQKKYGLNIIIGHISVPGNDNADAFLEWKPEERDAFYAALKKHPDDYKTSPPNVQEFENKLEELVSAGNDVVVVTISSGISGSYGFLKAAAANVLARHPEASVGCVDSLRFGPCVGLIAIYAAKLRDEGKSCAEITEWLEANKNCFRQSGWLDDLSFVAKKGRITHAKAFFGTLAGVKPLGEFGANGLTTVLTKATGAKAAMATMIAYMEKTIVNPSEQLIFIAQTCRYPQALEYKKLIEERIKPREVIIGDVHPYNGINIGPGLMASYYFGTAIAPDLSAEKESFADIAASLSKK